MRTLKRNQIQLWIVSNLGMQDILDEDGYFTGEMEVQFSEPRRIQLPLYPASGDVVSRTFGIGHDLTMVSVSEEKLNKTDLIFYNEPIGDFETTYDYSISVILPSLNIFNYGLKGRV